MRLFIAFISTFLISFSADTDKVSFYKYCDGYTFKYVDLKKDNTFSYYYRSCKGATQTKGNWTSSGDTIFLDHNVEKRDTFFLTEDQLLIRMDNQFKNFEPYSKMKSKKTKDKSDCCKTCYDRQKKQGQP